MTNFTLIRDYYKRGIWTIELVKNAAMFGIITTAEYKKITGEEFSI